MNANEAARSIFHSALAAASIPAAFDRHFPTLPPYEHTYAIALGKAALPMLQALCAHLPQPLAGGICCAPVTPHIRMDQVDYYTGGHPLPNEDSFAAARAALALLRRTGPRGPGLSSSSAAAAPPCSSCRSTLACRWGDTRSLYQSLVGSGATIAEINTVRKHYSAVKGGRLAAQAPHRFSFLVSDVAAQHLDALASGPTLQDHSTVADCRAIIHRYQMNFPPAVQAFFADPALPETPSLAPAPVATLLCSDDLLQAAQARAIALGYDVVLDNDCDDWDYADAADYLLARFRALRRESPRLCLLSGGEVTVRLGKDPGVGGRNQQFALACALKAEDPLLVLSAGSDGIDGNSPSAGAVADHTTIARAHALGLDPAAALANFDAYPLFHALGDTLITGPHPQQPARPAPAANTLEGQKESAPGCPEAQKER